jgi:hypothetical protein
MAKFSILSALSRKASKQPDTRNLAGGRAYAQSPKLELVSTLLTTFLKDEFYRTEKQTMARIQELIIKVNDPLFVAKAAVYVRQAHGMRSVSHLVAGELARQVKGADWTRSFFNAVVRRPDDVLEILGYYLGTYGRPIPNSLKKGLGLALSRFDDYQLSKYRREHADFKLVDAVNLLRPKATEPLGKLVRGELAAPGTWETRLTQAGDSDEHEDLAAAKKAAWTELVQGRKLGYLALLRNLRNLLTQAPELAEEVCQQLTQETAIRRSLVFPFQFLTALEVLQQGNLPEASRLMNALNQAVDLSLANVPDFEGRTLVALDCSGSMRGRPQQIGSLFAAVLVKRSAADLLVFSDQARYLSLNRSDSTLSLAKSIGFAQGGTNFNSLFEKADKTYDRIIILSDMQAWMGEGAPTKSFADYRRRHDAQPRIFSFDLKGYGSLQFPEPGVFALAGWSERSFGLLTQLDQDPAILLKEVESTPLAV